MVSCEQFFIDQVRINTQNPFPVTIFQILSESSHRVARCAAWLLFYADGIAFHFKSHAGQCCNVDVDVDADGDADVHVDGRCRTSHVG